MRELTRRFMLRPETSLKLVLATLMINVLGFASPLFVMLILGVYINSGFNETLITLSIGMFLAMLLQQAFRGARSLWAGEISREPDANLWNRVFDVLARARGMALERVPARFKSDLSGRVQTVRDAYDASNICAVLDAPFALLYLAAAFWLAPVLGFIGLAGIVTDLTVGLLGVRFSKKQSEQLRQVQASQKLTADSAFKDADTVRAFSADRLLGRTWKLLEDKITELRESLADLKDRRMSLIMASNITIRVLVYSLGALEVVHGNLSMTGLIVGNILISRCMRQAGGLVGASFKFQQAGIAARELKVFLNLPLDQATGTVLRRYKGGLAFKDLGFAWRGAAAPLFESLSLNVPPGSIVVVRGDNGAGKTTLARILAGLLQPLRGDVAADGVNLRQIAPDWWSRQIFYVPQEPVFLAATIRENITAARPDIGEDELGAIIGACGLDRFLANMEKGLDTVIDARGRNLAVGFKKRLALARAMAVGGRLAILDEPLEGLDAEGARAVFAIITRLARQGATIVAFSHDVNIIRGAHFIIDLNVKPVPGVSAVDQGPRGQGRQVKKTKDGGFENIH